MTLRAFHEPKDRLRLTIDDVRSYPTAKPVWAAPLSHPDHYLALLDGKGDEIITLVDPEKELDDESLRAIRVELSRRYLTATIETITDARSEFGATYWHVITQRGERDFVTQSLQENAQWLSPKHLLLVDVDGNRFEVPDISVLDERSRAFVETIL